MFSLTKVELITKLDSEMNENKDAVFISDALYDVDSEMPDFEELEQQYENDLRSQQLELETLKEDLKKIGTPESLGETMGNIVWEQFINQIGVVAGEDFIRENGATLDLRDSAHIQTTENFAAGKIATHNKHIDYQERYDKWQANFEHDENGNVITHKKRSGREEANIASGARHKFDKDRPKGSAERGTHIDHTISEAEIMRDPEAYAHLSEEGIIAFANSDKNLHEMPSSHNCSKGDNTTTEWLDNPNAKGQKPREIFADPNSPDYLSDEKEQEYREEDKEAREEYSKRKKEGEERSVKTGRQSQREEALRIGGKALRSVLMGLLASLIKDIIRKLISWLRSSKKRFSTFVDSVKEALRSFFSNIKQHLITAGDTFLTTILTAVLGPIVGLLKKAWIFLQQGYQSVKQAINFFADPKNKNMPFSLKMMEVGKIVVVGLTAGGAILLTQVLEKALMSFPPFAIEIPLFGSLASIVGLFLGSIVSGLIGALALNLIDRMIAKKQKTLNEAAQMDKRNESLATSDLLVQSSANNLSQKKINAVIGISERHQDGGQAISNLSQEVADNLSTIEEEQCKNEQTRQDIDELLAQI